MNLKIYYKIYKYNMKSINFYINEALKLGKSRYSCQPKTKKELKDIITQRIKDEGNEVDLNDIDVSKITDMSDLFYSNFNGNISKWDVSNVTDMNYMFSGCRSFNQDISSWDVSKVTDMSNMFFWCEAFNQDISAWNISNIKYSLNMFYNCPIKEKYKPNFK